MLNLQAIVLSFTGAATALSGILLSQIPTETQIGEVTKYGVASGCLLITSYLILFLIPKMLDIGKQINESTRAAIEKGFAELGAKLDRNNETVSSLIQQALFDEHQRKN